MTHARSILFTIVFICSSSPLLLMAQDGTWVSRSTTGFTARKGLASAVVDGKIYTISGIGNNGTTNTFVNFLEVYDPTTNTWSTPVTTGTATPRYLLTAAAVKGKIYAIGGTNGGDLTTLEVYDPAKKTWTTPTTSGSFTARHGMTSCVYKDKIYVIGGENNIQPLSLVEVFDPATLTWSSLTTTGTFIPATKLTCSVVGDSIYVMGGYDGAEAINALEILDPATNTWSTPITTGTFTPRDNLASAVRENRIYVLGGFGDGQELNTFEEFDPATNVWRTPPTNGSFTARSELIANVVNDQLYAIGGLNTGIMKTNEAFEFGLVSVKASPASHGLRVFPNPAEGLVTVSGIEAIAGSITISSTLGEKVMEVPNVRGSQCTIDLSKFTAGVYCLRYASEGSVISTMLIKE